MYPVPRTFKHLRLLHQKQSPRKPLWDDGQHWRTNITKIHFADDIDGLAGSEDERFTLVKNLDDTSSKFDMELSVDKTELMTNICKEISTKIKVRQRKLETVGQFKYLGSIITEEAS